MTPTPEDLRALKAARKHNPKFSASLALTEASDNPRGSAGAPGRQRHPRLVQCANFLSRRSGRSLVAAAAIIALVGVTFPLVQVAAEAAGTTVNVPLTDAAWTSTRFANSARTAEPYLSASNSNDTTYLKFDTRTLSGQNIVSAVLQLRVASTSATSGGVQVHHTASSWNTATLTNNNRPATTSSLVNMATVKVVPSQLISIPISVESGLWTGTQASFALNYSQQFVSTTFFRVGPNAPKLIVVVGPNGAPPAPVPPPTVAPSPPPVAPAPPAADGADTLAFAVAASNTSTKKVFAHYFPPYPISLDNKPGATDYYARNYLTPNGEGGIHANTGGFLRDRPIAQAPVGGDWKVANMKKEVIQASNAGIDGFTVDILSLAGPNWVNTLALQKGAEQSGRNFTIVPNLDMTAPAGKSSLERIAASLATLFASSSSYRLASGQYVLSTFAAERQTPEWWVQLKSTMTNNYGMDIALISVFLNPTRENIRAYAAVSYAEGSWGTRTVSTVKGAPNYAAIAHSFGTKWMSPVAPQDERPRSFLYAEADNTELLRSSWARALSDGADFVQLTTWNDYSEQTSMAPSFAHGTTFLDINAYYQTQFKTGKAPAITGDALYITHRIQFAGSIPQFTHRLMAPTLSGTGTVPRDTVEFVTFLAQPATVWARVGGVSSSWVAPAGVSAHLIPLAVGAISASVSRTGQTLLTVASPFTVTASPYVQDEQYYGVGGTAR